MVFGLIKKIIPSHNEKVVKKYAKLVSKINELEEETSKLSHSQIIEKTENLKKRFTGNGNDLIPEAFALVREASKRVLNMRHYDVQLIGGMALHDGCVSEMRTGEGKTLVSTLPAYLNALSGKGVHIVTVNDYLAQRDFDWMSRVHRYLGLTVGISSSGMSSHEKKEAYECDITYVTNTEIGFDYLRDNTRFYRESMTIIPRGFNFAIVDEVDSILIDEARTPLIISGPGKKSSDLYIKIDKIVRKLGKEDFEIDEKHNAIHLTEVGNDRVEDELKKVGIIDAKSSLYEAEAYEMVNHVVQSLRAHNLFRKDKDYVIQDNEIVIVDEFTGRMMEGRRYSAGLHQAIEAKENVEIRMENQTIASITYQNFFKLYKKLSGMTGTAQTEAGEFLDIYGLKIVTIPTHLPIVRKDHDDLIFKTIKDKYANIVDRIVACNKKGQPILVGTTSIEKSEIISDLLTKKGIKHNVLNAKNHAMEAQIIAEAGRKNAVTIATNMAGRGTDIILGGNMDAKILDATRDIEDEEKIKEITDDIRKSHESEKEIVKSFGGLFVLGSERHESRRIDNQLRGRSGRLGDNGESQFYLSLDDDLLRIFGGDRIAPLLSKLGFKDGQSMNHPMLNRAITKSQQKLEVMHYEMRKNVFKYDTIVNEQREIVYSERLKLIDIPDETIQDESYEILKKAVINVYESSLDKEIIDFDLFTSSISDVIGSYASKDINFQTLLSGENSPSYIAQSISSKCKELNTKRLEKYPTDTVNKVIKYIIITTLDDCWRDHLHYLSDMRESIHLRAYAQKDPLVEYKMDSFMAFQQMLDNYRSEVAKKIMHVEVRTDDDVELPREDEEKFVLNDTDSTSNAKQRNKDKIGRNSPCHCGSGKKFKNCHG